ncbi:MAG: RNA methyltransferase [Candidatus Omnitrophica bacterium]|nr:RNA methyltransferase [Candidatus Omnitrophota bacterium]MBU1128923.1 RNA methyltransferase [Candidatus Omnitrophota bacterium]MBU1656810.1 RNA methyltransferase [Candidatus Omnitrophota bacterium]MBU1784915.1 RNA methyltransferase [Candidatus Omnitrophota bacterium]MBU1852087.1 RNA methyltransferase [Candidatus Omnitrophota bacterium]
MEKASKTYLKQARELLREKEARAKAGVFAAEGEKIVRDLIDKGHVVNSALVSSSFISGGSCLSAFIEEKNIPVFYTGSREFDRASSLKSPEGIIALFQKKSCSLKEIEDIKPAFIVLCDGLQDPGNLGAIIRNAAAFNAGCLILTGDAVDIYNPKVIRSSSGTMLDIPIISCSYAELDRFKDNGYRVLVSHVDQDAASRIEEIKRLPRFAIIAFGSEGSGVSKKIISRADTFFHIPVSDDVESLNVTSASAIALYEFSKARLSEK